MPQPLIHEENRNAIHHVLEQFIACLRDSRAEARSIDRVQAAITALDQGLTCEPSLSQQAKVELNRSIGRIADALGMAYDAALTEDKKRNAGVHGVHTQNIRRTWFGAQLEALGVNIPKEQGAGKEKRQDINTHPFFSACHSHQIRDIWNNFIVSCQAMDEELGKGCSFEDMRGAVKAR